MRTRAVFAALLIGLVGLVTWATPAAGHSTLEETIPLAGERLDASPPEIGLRLNEPVEITLGSLRLLDHTGNEVPLGDPRHPPGDPTTVVADAPVLDDGAYVVLWEVVSADGHPVQGSWTFQVGAGAGSVGIIDSLRGDDTVPSRPGVDAGFWAARTLTYLGVIAAVGAAFMLLTQPDRAVGPTRGRLGVLALTGGIAATVGSVAGLVLYAATASQTPVLDAGGLTDAIDTRQGAAWMARIALGALTAVAAAAVITSRRGAVALAAGAAALVVSYTQTGHTAVDGTVAQIGAVAHMGGLGVWLGGLAALIWCRPALSAARWSRHALVAFAAVVVAGVAAAARSVDGFDAAVETNYGLLLGAKIALVAVVAVFGFAHHRRARAARAGGGDLDDDRFWFGVRAEGALAVAVVAVAAVMVATTPADVAVLRPVETTQVITLTGVTDGPWDPYDPDTVNRFDFIEADVTISPARVGTNRLDLETYWANTDPYPPHWVSISVANPDAGIPPRVVEAVRVGNHRFAVKELDLGVVGVWEVEITVWLNADDRVSTIVYASVE